ncbi:protein FAM131C isoform X2 [Esox lucius]|uniref:Family with sequence similarity 131 member C n=1 Tax=Esox lucius TaxID=8010 RepID=A0AAY5K313_ESOLU|nr:protein FAM131C isoform X2 [Esox lucius]
MDVPNAVDTLYGSHPPFSGGMSEKKSSSGYDIGELATSSLLGLLVTVKEHITKPTAMAQGRVAHLIEWKDWGAGGEGVGTRRDWRNFQEDEQLYSHLTDEIKEARFAAGVAEQFALAEAAMNIWPTHQDPEQPSSSTEPLQDSNFLSDFLLNGGSVGLPQHLYNIHIQANNNYNSASPEPQHTAYSVSAMSSSQPDSEQLRSENGRTGPVDAPSMVWHADSCSLSEDEVFYN